MSGEVGLELGLLILIFSLGGVLRLVYSLVVTHAAGSGTTWRALLARFMSQGLLSVRDLCVTQCVTQSRGLGDSLITPWCVTPGFWCKVFLSVFMPAHAASTWLLASLTTKIPPGFSVRSIARSQEESLLPGSGLASAQTWMLSGTPSGAYILTPPPPSPPFFFPDIKFSTSHKALYSSAEPRAFKSAWYHQVPRPRVVILLPQNTNKIEWQCPSSDRVHCCQLGETPFPTFFFYSFFFPTIRLPSLSKKHGWSWQRI